MERPLKSKKMLLMGTASIHLKNYLKLIEGVFGEVLVVTNSDYAIDGYRTITASMSFRPFYSIPIRIHRIRKIIAEFQPDIIHIHQANTCSFYGLKASAGKIPVLVTAWGSDVLYTPAQSIISKWLLKYVLNHTQYFTASCEHMKQLMLKYHGSSTIDIVVANFGIEFSFPDIPKEKVIYSNRYLNPHYRVDKIIEAFAEFNRHPEYQDWQLIIAADGSERNTLMELTTKLNLEKKIQFIGWVSPSENRSWYSRSTLYIALPVSDSTSLSLYEAMAAGCFLIVTDLPANREVITDGANGLLVDFTANDYLARALTLVNEEIVQKNKELAYNLASKQVNRNKFIRQYRKALHLD